MAYQVVWSPKALEDLEAIANYISRDSASYAASVINKILEATRNLGKFPFSGRVVPEFSEDTIREQFAYNYRIIYKVDTHNITVAAVIYGKRLLDKLDTQT